MTKSINASVRYYKKQLAQGDIQRAYTVLIKYIAELKSEFPSEYQTGNVSFGYMDYTYFPFFNAQLRARKLRFGIVLNHEDMRIELWLMGQNADVQSHYWELLKDTKWNAERSSMPRYSVLSVSLNNDLDFEQKEAMTATIIDRAVSLSKEIETFVIK